MDLRQRALALLSASFGIAWIPIAMIAAPGPAAWVDLTGDTGQAGVFFAVFSLATAVSVAVAGRAMDRVGRKPVLLAAHLAGAAGFLVAALAYSARSLPAFIAGTILLAGGMGTVALTRLAAGELFEPSKRAGAVARVQVSALAGALVGPFLLFAADPISAALGRSAQTLVWYLAPPLLLLSALLVALAPLPRGPPPAPPAASGLGRPLPRRALAAGVLALVCAQAAMVTVMGVTGSHLSHAGHATSTTSLVMAFHFLGMFGLSLYVGRFADRVGRRPTLAGGLGILAAGGGLAAFAPGALGLGVGLFLIGLGWSFAYIGGTVVLADVLPPAKRARFLGFVDFATALAGATMSFGGGLAYGRGGLPALGLAAIAVVALPLVLALLLREPSPGTYAIHAPDSDATSP